MYKAKVKRKEILVFPALIMKLWMYEACVIENGVELMLPIF